MTMVPAWLNSVVTVPNSAGRALHRRFDLRFVGNVGDEMRGDRRRPPRIAADRLGGSVARCGR